MKVKTEELKKLCGEIADKAAEHGSDQYKHDEHPGALISDTFTHM